VRLFRPSVDVSLIKSMYRGNLTTEVFPNDAIVSLHGGVRLFFPTSHLAACSADHFKLNALYMMKECVHLFRCNLLYPKFSSALGSSGYWYSL
jgi:hypothetical protein